MHIFLIRTKIFNFGLLDPKKPLKLTKTWSKRYLIYKIYLFVLVSSLMDTSHRKRRICSMPFCTVYCSVTDLQLVYLKVLKTMYNYADFTKEVVHILIQSVYFLGKDIVV